VGAFEQALRFHEEGVAVLPVPFGSKKVDYSWHFWQRGPQDAGDIAALFGQATEANIAALFGCPSGGLFGLDCDDPRSFTETEARLAGLGVTTWTVQSNCTAGHVGGGTYLLRAPGPVKSSGLVRGQGEYSIVWGTHPSGSTYAIAHADKPIWTLPALDALPWLKLTTAEQGRPSRRFPSLAWQLFNGLPTERSYASRSEQEYAIMCSLIRAGYAYQDALHLFDKYPLPGRYHELRANEGEKRARSYFDRSWTSALAFIAADSEASEEVRQAKAWASSRSWPGRSGATDRAVYLAHLSIAEKCGKESYGASARELADLSGVTWQTAANATRRLVKAGLLSVEAEARATLPQKYKLFSGVSCFDTLLTPIVVECQSMIQQKDTFRFAGLGKTGLDVWACLQKHPDGTGATAIAQETGRGRMTIHRKLAAMFQLGMVEPLGDGLWRSLPGADLEEAARELGVSGMGQAQRVKHEKDRRRRRTALDFRRKVKEARANRS
jgi:predicted transcriptional regulator